MISKVSYDCHEFGGVPGTMAGKAAQNACFIKVFCMPLLQSYADFHGFSMISNSFHAFSMIFIDFLDFHAIGVFPSHLGKLHIRQQLQCFAHVRGAPAAVF